MDWVVSVMIKKIIRKWLCRFYFNSDGEPKRCIHCNNDKFTSKVTSSFDVGVGTGITCEEEILCKKCDSVVGYWAYGGYDPRFMIDYLKK